MTGDEIRQLREAQGWTQPELARRAGVSKGTISMFERGQSTPQRGSMQKILHALEVGKDEQLPENERLSWSHDIKVFLDVIGLYLDSYEPEDRHAVMREMTAWLFERRRGVS